MMPASVTIKNIRIHLCLGQDEFAEKIGVTKSTVCKYENGDRHPRIKIIRKIKELAEANNIHVKVEDFFD
jgi:DNA-binding XRE family transcriptional regulator